MSLLYISVQKLSDSTGGGAAIVWKDGITLYFFCFCFCFLLPLFFHIHLLVPILMWRFCLSDLVIYTALQAWPRKEPPRRYPGGTQARHANHIKWLLAAQKKWSVFGMSYYLLGQLMHFTQAFTSLIHSLRCGTYFQRITKIGGTWGAKLNQDTNLQACIRSSWLWLKLEVLLHCLLNSFKLKLVEHVVNDCYKSGSSGSSSLLKISFCRTVVRHTGVQNMNICGNVCCMSTWQPIYCSLVNPAIRAEQMQMCLCVWRCS